MKTTKVNHSEILNSLKAEFTTLTSAYESASNAWRNSGTTCEDRDAYLLRTMSSIREQLRDLEAQMKFHEIMLQDKKYATEWLWSDAHAYEIIEEKSATIILVRQLKATIKPEAQKALHDSFVPGGFCGHFENDLQEWDFDTCESNPIETIRKHKDGRWYGCGKRRFTIEAEPYEHFDYNF
jgi:hypothetical protein